MRRALFLASAILLLGTAAWAAGEEPSIRTPLGDPVVAAADAEAHRTLPIFWAKFGAHEPGVDSFDLKVELPRSATVTEVMWMRVQRRSGGRIEGVLVNEPENLEGLHLGSPISVGEGQIRDWSYRKGGKLYGQYFVRAMIDRAPPEVRAQASKVLAPTPLEPGSR